MKFTKERWSKLNPVERGWLVHYHKYCNELGGSGGYNMPEGCGYCPVCGYEQMGELVCIKCIDEAERLYTKMRDEIKKEEEDINGSN